MLTITRVLILTLLFVHLDCDVQSDRPKIKSDDGNLIIEPAFDKNIVLQTNGPKSTVFVGGINLLTMNLTDSGGGGPIQPPVDLDKYLNGRDGILERLERLESRSLSDDLLFNLTILWRRVNRLTTRVNNLQSRMNRRDECQSRPCLNGGTCLNLFDGYHCLCPSNWEGANCDQDVNECRNFAGTDLGCQNGGECINRPGSYECKCKPNFYGLHCTRKEKDCSGGDFEMCGHGTCVPVNSGIKCICDQGWTTNGTSVACRTDVNECDSSQGPPRCSANPKVDCINLPGSFRCGQCPPGYEGDGFICNDIDECQTILPNGGCSDSPRVTCHNTIGSRICGPCPEGYQGDGVTCVWRGSCSVNHGGCHPSAQCIDNPAVVGGRMASCVCPPGTIGDGVGLNGCFIPFWNSTGCVPNPCGVHGQCHPLRRGFTCICHRGYGGAFCDAASNYCTSNPCLNGGTCRPDESSARGFRCECTAQYSGDLCHVIARTCGGYLPAEEGSIVYPLSNNTMYNHNAKCAWVIQTENDKVLNVTFSKFNLEASPDCRYDFLQIHDGRSSASQIIGRFCGNEFPKGGNIVSSHNTLYFWFRTDQTVAKDGFALHWTSINPVCGGEVDATIQGRISTPGSPGKYPPNRDCYWHLFTTLGKRIQLHFFALDIEAHQNCSYDFVAIYDGERTSDPLISKYCNSTQPPPLQSSGSDLLIHFHSDAYGAGNGFQITFAPTEGVPGCGGYYTTEKGEIASPSFEGRYLDGLFCEYKIKTSADTNIRINITSFHLERSRGCIYDYLKIYDGPSEKSRLVGKFCGTTYPNTYTSSSNELYMIFRTDHSASSEGFKITYESICRKTIIGDSGVLTSPGYPFNYPMNRVCEYIIITAPGKAVQLSFQDFDVEDNRFYNCRYDNIEVRNGANSNATLLGRFCGSSEHIPPVLTSTHNYMYLKFTSDMSVSGTGFYANFTTIDVECGGIYRENTGLITHPPRDKETYSNDQTCTWILIAPDGMHIKLTWNKFDLENMPSCRSDYVELNEVDGNNEKNTIGKYCGKNLPPALTTTTNQLEIKFESDSSVKSEGFSLSYTFLDDRAHCGGTYTKAHGFIYSPGWPKKYSNSRDCVWTINAPSGQQIRLNFTQFDLERAISRNICDYGDYLEIRNGASQTAPLIGKYCGTIKSQRITSMANVLYLRFHSDSYITGNGFQIEWDSTITGCGGTLSSPSGSISSPNYPSNYNENAECFYRIVTSAGSRIRVTFADLELERTVSCRDDYVQVFDGRDENSPSFGKYCFMSPDLRSIESSTNYVFIKFRSDFYIGGKGFLLNYDTICQNNVSGIHGIIESPGYPGSYPQNMNCLWTINVPKGNKINVTFTDFDIMRAPTIQRFSFPMTLPGQICNLGSLQIKETSDVNYGEKLCGSNLPARFSSKTNSLQIKFVSAGYMAHRGFKLEWARYGCGGHIQKIFATISVSSSMTAHGDLECEWVLETPTGTSVTFTVYELYMVDTPNCTTDAVEVYNGRSGDSPLLTKFCHRTTFGTTRVISTSNYMMVRFVKKSSLKDVHFIARFDGYHSGCGGRIEALSGVIHSKNYPKNYDSNMNCMWIISVPRDHRIALNFMDFDLYSASEDDCDDSVRIYDAKLEISVLNANYTQRICPNTQVSTVLSKTRVLGVQFLSNGDSHAAKGFKANFTVICGATITANYEGIIATDQWHASYIQDNCTWTILAPTPDQKISLTISHLSISRDTDIITNRKCPSSYLRVYDGNDIDAPIVEEYCGRKVPPTIVSRGSALTVVLGAYNGSVQGQFSAHYTAVNSACGGTLTSEEGTIASPNYPQSYPPSASCEWILRTSPGNRVYITFEQFDLVYSENCNEDYVEVREDNGAGRLLGVYCGTDLPTNTTTGTVLYIKFHSNSKYSGRGFVMHYGFLHGNEITGKVRGEITSPLYPNNYVGAGEYSWRISTEDLKTISMSLDRLDIPVIGQTCYNKLAIYDGYDEDAPKLDEFCGSISGKVVQTSSNVAFLKLSLDDSNTGSTFDIRWASADAFSKSGNSNDKTNCGFNTTKLISPGELVTITSPGYPNSYENDMICEWVFQATKGRHVNIHFNVLMLEQMPLCFADYISIYSGTTSTSWKPVKENICLTDQIKEDYNSSSYMKVVLTTDSSMTREGFEAVVSSECGGFVSDLSGVIGPQYEDILHKVEIQCQWTIKVRPGRVIKLDFEHFNITANNNKCQSFVSLRNGESIESPLLGSGKYCGLDHEIQHDLESSSNAVFVTYFLSYKRSSLHFQNFRLRYEEKGFECGVNSKLDSDHSWEIISSPNYPSVPVPYSECVWVFTGPPGEILRIDFIDRFDLEKRDECKVEYVEIRDGSTDLSPIKGRFCREKPETIKTSGNNVYIRYLSQVTEPRNGFKANVSIDTCGGTIHASRKGEVSAPGYPHMKSFPSGTICEWRIITNPRTIIRIKPEDIQLPESEMPCGTKITIEEAAPINNTVTVLHTYCSDEESDLNSDNTVVETSSNEVIIKLKIGKSSDWSPPTTTRGFRFTFNTTHSICGGDVTTPEGFIMTPGYPRETTMRYCQWRITVPDVRRRVRLEILDSNIEKHRIGMYNDLGFHSVLATLSSSDKTTQTVFESSGNTLALYLWLGAFATNQRFKAKFSSDEPSLCGGSLTGESGELNSLDIDRSYTCQWRFSPGPIANVTEFKSLYIKAKVNSTTSRGRCSFSEPKITFTQTVEKYSLYSRELCGNKEVSYRIPSTGVDIKATKNQDKVLFFHIEWKLQPCGGIMRVNEESVNVIDVPNNFNDTLDCAWMVIVSEETRIQLTLQGSFVLDCENEFIKISQGLDDSLVVLGEYCKDKMQVTPLITPYKYMLVQYHSNIKSNTTIRLMAESAAGQCGGILTDYQRILESPHFPKNYDPNIECVWEIKANIGNRVSLEFIERFAIEDKANCTKDAVIIYDWKDDEYVEMAKLCGRMLPPTLNSTFNQMKVVLRTDSDINLDGFKAIWYTKCGGIFNATKKEKILYSPNFPDLYSPAQDCTYEISGNGERVYVKFLEFEFEGTYPSCEFDNLTINAESDYNILQETYCGTEMPPAINEFTKIKLELKTDRYIERKGFKLAYSIYECGGRITAPAVITSSPTGSYHLNENCTWYAEAPPDKIVIVKFQDIETESNSDCHTDFVALYNGPSINEDKRIALMCGYVNGPTVFRSVSNKMLVQFVSDNSLNYRGFKADIFFSYSTSVGCGGEVVLSKTSSYTLKSPLIGNNVVYENFLDCLWTVKAPQDYTIQIEFKSFHVASCAGVNQTAIGYSKCECDHVEIKDGLNPNDLTIGTFCGHTLPPKLVSSENLMSVRLSTDGEIQSSGFEAQLTVKLKQCGLSFYTISKTVQTIKSPLYDFTGRNIPRGIHCRYNFRTEPDSYDTIRFTIKNLDLRPGVPDVNECNKDKLIVASTDKTPRNASSGKDLIISTQTDYFTSYDYLSYEQQLRTPSQFVFCGIKKDLDLYLYGDVTVNLITSSESDSVNHKGVEIQVSYIDFCGRNYTELYGRIQSGSGTNDEDSPKDCYTLISVPVNYTISLYFMRVVPDYWSNTAYLDVYDGDKTTSQKLIRFQSEYEDKKPVFSSGRYILLHSHFGEEGHITYDLNYVATDKGKGCGGKLHNLVGRITSPLYPLNYRQKGSCEWELETTSNTKIHLHFVWFDLGPVCDQNYVQLVDRSGKVISTYCSETPADYTSSDNYVKVVFTTTMNNSGTGWIAEFVAVL